jgi:hypothetical protein
MTNNSRIPRIGAAPGAGFQERLGRTGELQKYQATTSDNEVIARNARWTFPCVDGRDPLAIWWAYMYPPNNRIWKNRRQVAQIAEVPPNHGNRNLPRTSWT